MTHSPVCHPERRATGVPGDSGFGSLGWASTCECESKDLCILRLHFCPRAVRNQPPSRELPG